MRKIYIPMAVANIVMIIILVDKSYIVADISYKNIALVFAVTLTVFELTGYIINKNNKICLPLLIVFIVLAAVIFRYSNFISYLDNLKNLATRIDNLTKTASSVDFSLIYPFYVLIIPILTFLYLILFKFNLGTAATLINTLILVLYELLEFNTAVKTVLPLYIFSAYMNYNPYKFSVEVEKNYAKNLFLYYLIICIGFSSVIYCFVPDTYGKEADVIQYKFNNMINKNQDSSHDFVSIGINTGRTSILGKKLKTSDYKLSLISGDVPDYLRTKVYYNYNHDRWTESRDLILLRARHTLNVLDSAAGSGLIEKNIEYNREKTSKIKTISVQNLNDDFYNIMISPNFITEIISSENSDIVMYSDENYLAGRHQTKYAINFYDYDDIETFEDYAVSKYSEDINSVYKSYNVNDNALNFTSSQRVRELADKITLTASNNTEKLKLIKSYLMNNYNYNLQPDKMESNSTDYVDFFLFDGKEGYCTSFATAAVMLCRAAGIPARYVEGFKISGEKDYKGRYILRSSDAHAWCEVLTSADKGTWTILDTTPGYGDNDGVSSTENAAADNDSQNSSEQKQPQEEPVKEDKRTNTEKKIENAGSIKKFQKYNYIATIICTAVLLGTTKILRRKIILKNIVNSEAVMPLYTFVLKRLKTIGLSKKIYETDREFAFRIKDKLDIRDLVEDVYREIYGGEKVNLNKNTVILTVEKTVKRNSNILKYYIFF